MVSIFFYYYYYFCCVRTSRQKSRFEILMYIFLAYIVLTLPVGMLPRSGLMASYPRNFCLLPISAIKKFIYIYIYNYVKMKKFNSNYYTVFHASAIFQVIDGVLMFLIQFIFT